jgi:FkbM family methyltransferase
MINRFPIASRLFARLLPNALMTVVDAGARGGGELVRWRQLDRNLRLLNFEPDPKAYETIQRMAQGHPGVIRTYTTALARTQKARPLYLSKASEYNTSLLPINLDRYRRKGWTYRGQKVRVSDIYEIARTEAVDCVSIDDFAAQEGIADIDYIKVDIEGAELELLGASPDALGKAVGVSVDVIFHDDWIGAPVFADVDRFLREKGFVLYDLRALKRTEQYDTPFTLHDESGEPHGQIACGDAIYLRDFLDTKAQPPSFEKLMKLAVAAEVNRHADFAFELLVYMLDHVADEKQKAELALIYEEAAADYKLWMTQYAGSRRLSGIQAWSRRMMPEWMMQQLRPFAWTLRRLAARSNLK